MPYFFHLIHFLEVTFGSCPGLSGLVNCTPARLIAFHSLIPDLQLHSSQSELSMQMRRGELVILELECRVRTEQLGAHENNTLVFGKINTLIKIIQQQWNWEYSQAHDVWEYVPLAEQKSYFWEQWVTMRRFILRVARRRGGEVLELKIEIADV